MPINLDQALAQMLSFAFDGAEPSPEIRAALTRQPIGGVTLFRGQNMESPEQVRTLTAGLQAAARASSALPLLIGADHEGGTMLPVTGITPFPGHLALGATGSPELARRVGVAMGRELAAIGINVDYAPVCDVLANGQNPAVGPRSFGGDPALAARLSAAMVQGLQEAGVAATAKHFPGHGDAMGDSHYVMPVSTRDRRGLEENELPPFISAIRAGAKLVMTAHVAFPGLDGVADLPATLSAPILRGLLRRELEFGGVVISDAMDMKAIEQGTGLVIDAIAAIAAGVDMLLLMTGMDQLDIYARLLQATRRRLLSAEEVIASARRVIELRRWAGGVSQPALDVVGCREHRELAKEVAARSITLVRDAAGLIPLRLSAEAHIAAIMPHPVNLTPADTSSYVTPTCAQGLRRYHPAVDELLIPINPSETEIAALRERARDYTLLVVGTISALTNPGQAALVNALLETSVPTIVVSLRQPYDIQCFAGVPTYVCTYGILEPSMQALAHALWGQIPFAGHLPVSL